MSGLTHGPASQHRSAHVSPALHYGPRWRGSGTRMLGSRLQSTQGELRHRACRAERRSWRASADPFPGRRPDPYFCRSRPTDGNRWRVQDLNWRTSAILIEPAGNGASRLPVAFPPRRDNGHLGVSFAAWHCLALMEGTNAVGAAHSSLCRSMDYLSDDTKSL